MNDDLLSQATRALRETVDGSCEDARPTEERLIARLPRTRRLRLVRPWGFSLAAVLIGSSVWAAGQGPLRPLFETLDLATPAATLPAPVAAPKPRRPAKIAARLPALEEPAAEPVVPPVEPSPPPEEPPPRATPPQAARQANAPETAQEPAPEPPALPTAGGSSALDVYEQAHQLHFLRRDYPQALIAWDRYLALAPTGSLALEARFHRAVCLVRLGNKQEARRALEPFARGAYGTYRQTQAKKLLSEIGAEAAP